MLLTIGIPTFNRCNFLKNAIESILVQCKPEGSNEIEILISDNASSDNTVLICNDFIKKHPNIIRYFSHEKNMGFDKNVDSIFLHSQGEFVWLLGDDDELNPGAIEKVINVINNYKTVKVIFSNYDECDGNLNISEKRIRPEIKEDAFCNSGENFFIKNKFLAGVMSSVIFNKAAWVSAALEKKYYNGLIFISKIVAILKEQRSTSYVISNKLFKYRVGTSTWCDDGMALYRVDTNWLDTVYLMEKSGYSKEFTSDLINKILKSYPKLLARILVRSISMHDRIYIAKSIIKNFWNRALVWFVLLPELCVPTFAYKTIYSLIKGRTNIIKKRSSNV